MKGFFLRSILVPCAMRGGLFLGVGLALVQPCAGDSGFFEGTGSLANERFSHTATLLPNGTVLVAGGLVPVIPFAPSFEPSASAELYNPASGTWSVTGSLSTARVGHTAILLSSGKVLVAGGENHDDGILASAELYDPGNGSWSATGSLNIARGDGHTATLLPDGNVLVAGVAVSGSPSAELYDPASGSWSVTGSLSTERGSHTATLLPNGKVLVAGGFNGSSYLATAELYDPGSGSWSATGSLNTARSGHTATLLLNGMVLVAGSYNSLDDGSADYMTR